MVQLVDNEYQKVLVTSDNISSKIWEMGLILVKYNL